MKTRSRSLALAVACSLVILGQPEAQANLTLVSNPTGTDTWYDTVNATWGYEIAVGSTALTVSQLGFWDALGDGLIKDHTVGIYDMSGLLLASVSVPAGSGATLTGGYRWVSLANGPTLNANTHYVIGGTMVAGVNDLQRIGSATIDSHFSYVNGRVYSDNLSTYVDPGAYNLQFPSYIWDTSGGNTSFAPNAILDVTPVPEPTTVLAGALLLLPFAASTIRRMRKNS